MYVACEDWRLDSFSAKHVNFVLPMGSDDPKLLTELRLRRNMSVCKESFQSSPGDLDALADWFIKYLSIIQKLKSVIKGSGLPLSGLAGLSGFLWSSPLSGLASTSHFSLDSLLLEEIMALLMYASLLHQKAQAICDALLPFNDGNTNNNDPLTAAALFRQAAGIYAYIKTDLIPPALSDMPVDAPSELAVPALDCLQSLALAGAQGVAAYRAEEKGTSPATLAAVHAGAIQLWEDAAIKAKLVGNSSSTNSSSTVNYRPISERFYRYLAVCSGLHYAKALRAQAAMLRDDHDLGTAVACLKTAAAKVSQCLIVADKDEAMKPAFRAELEAINTALKLYDHERQVVHMQGISSTIPPLPEGKVVVSPVSFEHFSTASCDHLF